MRHLLALFMVLPLFAGCVSPSEDQVARLSADVERLEGEVAKLRACMYGSPNGLDSIDSQFCFGDSPTGDYARWLLLLSRAENGSEERNDILKELGEYGFTSFLHLYRFSLMAASRQGSMSSAERYEHWRPLAEVLERNAFRGHAESQFYLACHYWSGLGITRDHRRAAFWLRQAESGGFSPAGGVLKTMLDVSPDDFVLAREPLVGFDTDREVRILRSMTDAPPGADEDLILARHPVWMDCLLDSPDGLESWAQFVARPLDRSDHRDVSEYRDAAREEDARAEAAAE
jgi:hypothetical protein